MIPKMLQGTCLISASLHVEVFYIPELLILI